MAAHGKLSERTLGWNALSRFVTNPLMDYGMRETMPSPATTGDVPAFDAATTAEYAARLAHECEALALKQVGVATCVEGSCDDGSGSGGTAEAGDPEVDVYGGTAGVVVMCVGARCSRGPVLHRTPDTSEAY